MEEIWRDVKGYEGLYQVSNLGRVRALHYHTKNCIRLRKLQTDKDGYAFVFLSKDAKAKGYRVHRLVAEAFIPNPSNYPIINHKDEIKSNNMVWVNNDGSIDLEKSNLEWCNVKYNTNYGECISKRNKTKRDTGVFARLSVEKGHSVRQLTKDGIFVKTYVSAMEAMRQTGINEGNINACCNHKHRVKSAGGFIWEWA